MKTKEQILIDKVTPNLPLNGYPEREILPKMKENFKGESITLKTELEINSMVDLGEAGGIGCEIRIKGAAPGKVEQVFLASITHIRIGKSAPNYQALQKYKIKRIKKLARQSKNRF